MKILLQSYWFWPSVGGLEGVSQVLAEGFSEEGHIVTVVTHTPSATERPAPYTVVRRTNWFTAARLVQSHDLIYSNGSTTHFFPLAVIYRKPFVWTHTGNTIKWIKDSSWSVVRPDETSLARLWRIFNVYPVIQVFGRWLVAQFASANITITNHMALHQPLPRQRVMYNPIDYHLFAVHDFAEAEQALAKSRHTFSFLGRLVKGKGVDDLLHALALLNRRREQRNAQPATLQIIGDGPDKIFLANLAKDLGIDGQIQWMGSKTGAELVSAIRDSGIFVIPSRWEEPMGIVALELMAAGKPLIVSLRGGLSECAGDACLTFSNGDREALAEAMERLSADAVLQKTLIMSALTRIKKFNTEDSIRAYLELFAELIRQPSSTDGLRIKD